MSPWITEAQSFFLKWAPHLLSLESDRSFHTLLFIVFHCNSQDSVIHKEIRFIICLRANRGRERTKELIYFRHLFPKDWPIPRKINLAVERWLQSLLKALHPNLNFGGSRPSPQYHRPRLISPWQSWTLYIRNAVGPGFLLPFSNNTHDHFH